MRGSDLALAQAVYVARRTERELSITAEPVVIKSRGDLMSEDLLADLTPIRYQPKARL